MSDRTNNEITEDIVRIRDNYGMNRADRDALADAANRIQNQGKALALAEQQFDEWLDSEHSAHSVYDHRDKSSYERWKSELRTAFMAGSKSNTK